VRRKRKMKRTVFSNIQSLEDLHKRKLRLEKKLIVTEKSISEKTDIAKLLINTSKRAGSLSGENDSDLEVLGYLLPLGIKLLLKQIQNNPDKIPLKRLLFYFIVGSIPTLLVYKYMEKSKSKSKSKRKSKTE
jgi:hypothetical protein